MYHKNGSLEYKCRRCGKVRVAFGVPKLLVSLAAIIAGEPLPKEFGVSPSLIDIHNREDGHLGVADLIGGTFG